MHALLIQLEGKEDWLVKLLQDLLVHTILRTTSDDVRPKYIANIDQLLHTVAHLKVYEVHCICVAYDGAEVQQWNAK